MNTTALLALIGDLYQQIVQLTADNEKLREQPEKKEES